MGAYFIEPFLAACANRSKLASENQIIGGPDQWFNNSNLETFGLLSVNFDFFINWNRELEIPLFDKNLWLKRPVNADLIDIETISDDELIDILRNDKFLDLTLFARSKNLTASAIIFNDSVDWTNNSTKLIRAYWPKYDNLMKGLRIERIYRDDIENLIREKSGGAVKIGSKQLVYGTSRLECYLAKHTNALWPGDVDLLLCDKASFSPLVLLEFKKHTKNAKHQFGENRLSNYYSQSGYSEDGRKYDRLSLLSSQLTPGMKLPFLIIYYSTESHELSIMIESVIGGYKQLKGGVRETILFEANNIAESSKYLIHRILMMTGLRSI